MKTRTG